MRRNDIRYDKLNFHKVKLKIFIAYFMWHLTVNCAVAGWSSVWSVEYGWDFCHIQNMHTGSGAHSPPIQWVPVAIIFMGHEYGHSFTSSAKVMKE